MILYSLIIALGFASSATVLLRRPGELTPIFPLCNTWCGAPRWGSHQKIWNWWRQRRGGGRRDPAAVTALHPDDVTRVSGSPGSELWARSLRLLSHVVIFTLLGLTLETMNAPLPQLHNPTSCTVLYCTVHLCFGEFSTSSPLFAVFSI